MPAQIPHLPNGIHVGTQAGLSGLAVQQNGNLLAASVAPDNAVYLMDKVTGAALSSFSVNSPAPVEFLAGWQSLGDFQQSE